MRDFLKLHLVVAVWGVTAVIGKMIHLPAVQVTCWRTLIATLGLAVLAWWWRISLRSEAAWRLLAMGILVAGHWVCFFASAQVSTASVSLAGLPTMMLWCAMLEPWLVPGKRWRWHQGVLGLVMTAAFYLIFQYEWHYGWGLVLSVLAAILGSLFAVLTSREVKSQHYVVISFYQMLGASVTSGVMALIFHERAGALRWPTLSDFFWLMILGLICTVYAYAAYVELLRRLSVFVINLVYNLEPVYGMVLAAIVFREAQQMSGGFYGGVAILVSSVLAAPFFQRKEQREMDAGARATELT